MGEMIVAHDISHGLNANQQVRADGIRRRDTDNPIRCLPYIAGYDRRGCRGRRVCLQRKGVNTFDYLKKKWETEPESQHRNFPKEDQKAWTKNGRPDLNP